MAELLRQTLAIVGKDLRLELRSRTAFLSMFAFTILVLAIFNYAHDPTAVSAQNLAPSVLWITFSFAGMLGLNRGFAIERENRAIDGLLLAPLSRTGLYVGKALGNFIFVGVVEAIALPAFAIFFNVPVLPVLGPLVLVIALATIGFVAVGTLLSAMAVTTRFAEMILALLVLPFLLPPVSAAAQITAGLFDGLSLARNIGWLKLLIGFDIVFVVLCMLIFEWTLEE